MDEFLGFLAFGFLIGCSLIVLSALGPFLLGFLLGG